MTAGLAAMVVSLAQPASAATDEEKEYLKVYGMFVCESSGIKELELNDDEAAMLLEGFSASLKGAKFPDNLQEIGPKMQAYLQGRAEANMNKAASKNKEIADNFFKELEKDADIQ